MVKVKICGITCAEDARACVKAGADALGFNFALGPRKITPEKAEEIVRELAPDVCRVGVFVNEDEKTVNDGVNRCRLTAVQFHGDESPEYCSRFQGKVKVIKAFRVREDKDLERMRDYRVDFYLLDALVEEMKGKPCWGGTGRKFDWRLAKKANEIAGPIILAGGLNPDNVTEAVRAVRPFAVDVASGVEKSPGRKDPELMRNFVLRAKGK